MDVTAEVYYTTKTEIKYRVGEMFRSVDTMRDHIMDTDRLKDELANIDHQLEMIRFAYKVAESKIDAEIGESLKEMNGNGNEKMEAM